MWFKNQEVVVYLNREVISSSQGTSSPYTDNGI